MMKSSKKKNADVFVSYASQDVERVVSIVQQIESAGVTVWRDENRILGGDNYGPEIVRGIRDCKVLALMCSVASMRSRNVKQEIQLAWRYQRPYLPLLLDNTALKGFPEQLEYWLEGCQWIEVMDRPPKQWRLRVLHAIEKTMSTLSQPAVGTSAETVPSTDLPFNKMLEALWRIASFTDQIWPVPADMDRRGLSTRATRGLGLPQPSVRHSFPLGSRVQLNLETDRRGHLLLLDRGPEGIVYCLCPSLFAPCTQLVPGRHVLPQPESPHDSFFISGHPGREELLAIYTDEPLRFGWMHHSQETPAPVLHSNDIESLLNRLRDLQADQWTALATYFDVTNNIE